MDIHDKDTVNSKTVILDVGSGCIRAGISGEEGPTVEIPNVIAISKPSLLNPISQTLIGEEAEEKKPVAYDIIYPVKKGLITDLDALFKVLDEVLLNRMALDTSKCKIIFAAECPDKDKLLDALFEKYNPTEIFLTNQDFLSLCASGLSDGLVVNFGEGTSHVTPFIENKEVLQEMNNAYSWGCNGRDLTEKLMDMLKISKTPQGLKCAREILKEHCFVVPDPKESKEPIEPIPYKVDDEQQITISGEQLKCPEMIFQDFHIQNVIVKAINNCEEKYREALIKNIVLAGECTMLNGFPERLKNEIKTLVGDETEVNIIAPEDRHHSAWKGGARVASEGLFPNNWTTKK
ncbi:actin, cytoplasmic-like [Saccostrea cucullata]|uniref:actin, cytoplasmic-like n=1 Tax=Saccostrea cuccullata TaxID=36930 RepID=UPI002ED381E5